MFSIDQAPQSREQRDYLPAMIARVLIDDVDLKEVKDGSGEYFLFSLNIIEPPEFRSMKINHRITWSNKSDAAVEIGRAHLGDLLFTLQVNGFRSVDELARLVVGKELIVETENQEGVKGGVFTNVINHWSLGGKHRSPKRSLEKISLGETGRPIKPPSGAAKVAQRFSAFDEDRPPF